MPMPRAGRLPRTFGQRSSRRRRESWPADLQHLLRKHGSHRQGLRKRGGQERLHESPEAMRADLTNVTPIPRRRRKISYSSHSGDYMLRRHSTPLAMVLLSTLVVLFASRIATAADAARGAALYESRCGT